MCDGHAASDRQHVLVVSQIERNLARTRFTIHIDNTNLVFLVKVGFVEGDNQLNAIKCSSQCKRSKIAQCKADVVCAIVFVGRSKSHIPFGGQGGILHCVKASRCSGKMPFATEVSNLDGLSLYQSQCCIGEFNHNGGYLIIAAHRNQCEVRHGDGLCLRIVGISNIVIHAIRSVRVHTIAVTHAQVAPREPMVRIGNLQFVLLCIDTIDFLDACGTRKTLELTIIDVVRAFGDDNFTLLRECYVQSLSSLSHFYVGSELVLAKEVRY